MKQLSAPGPLRKHMRSSVSARSRADARDSDVEQETLRDQAQSTHEEARMVLPGIQALFGFQLIAVFNPPFWDLSARERSLHLASLVLVAIAIGLIMAPAAYHRLAESTQVSRRWIRIASRDIALAMLALVLAISIELYLVAMMIVADTVIAVLVGAAVACLLGWLWFAIPLARRASDRASGE